MNNDLYEIAIVILILVVWVGFQIVKKRKRTNV